MKNNKVLFLTSLLAVATLAGCGTRTSEPIILPEADQVESFDNDTVVYPNELLVNHRNIRTIRI